MINAVGDYQYSEAKKNLMFTSQIRERHFGVFQGRPDSELKVEASKAKNDFTFKPKGGESKEEVMKRAALFVGLVQDQMKCSK